MRLRSLNPFQPGAPFCFLFGGTRFGPQDGCTGLCQGLGRPSALSSTGSATPCAKPLRARSPKKAPKSCDADQVHWPQADGAPGHELLLQEHQAPSIASNGGREKWPGPGPQKLSSLFLQYRHKQASETVIRIRTSGPGHLRFLSFSIIRHQCRSQARSFKTAMRSLVACHIT